MTQAKIDEKPSTFGELLVIVFKMLTNTRKSVTRRLSRPEMACGGITKLTWEKIELISSEFEK